MLEKEKLDLLASLEVQRNQVKEKHENEWSKFKLNSEKEALESQLTEFKL